MYPIITLAEDPNINPEKYCSENNAVSEAMCLSYRADKADAELNRVYKELMKKITNNKFMPENIRKIYKKKQIKAQRLWVKFKEVECNEVSEYLVWGASGSGVSSAHWGCILYVTKQRTKNLKEMHSIK